MRRIPNRAEELEIRTTEEFWGSWVDQPVQTGFAPFTFSPNDGTAYINHHTEYEMAYGSEKSIQAS